MTKSRPTALAVLALSLAATPALAHHSAAAFDRSKAELVTGTVRKFDWANPHTWVYLEVPNNAGGADQWVIEGPPPSMLVRAGWNGKTLAPGDKVSLVVAPYRDGSRGGEFILTDSTVKPR